MPNYHLESNPKARHISVGEEKKVPVPAFIACVLGFVLQVFLAPNIAINGISPNIMLIALAPVALTTSQRASVIAGFLMGFLFDLLGAGPIGVMALVMAVVGFTLPLLIKSISTQSFVSWMIVMAICCFGSFFAYDIVCSIIGYETSFLSSILYKVLPWTIYTLVIAALVFPIMRRLLGNGFGKGQASRPRIKL